MTVMRWLLTFFIVAGSALAQGRWPDGATVNWWVDTNTRGLKLDGSTDPTRVRNEVRSAVQWALGYWKDKGGLTSIQFVESSAPASNRIVVQFYPNSSGFGDTPSFPPGSIEVNLNSNSNYVQWTTGIDTRTNPPGPPFTNIDIVTTILHEIGHTFGLPHLGAGNVMEEGYHGSRRTLTSQDVSALRNLYGRPPLYHVTVKNSFEAGSFKADGLTYRSGSEFEWEGGSSHVLEAIDGQSDGVYLQRYQNWAKFVNGSLAETYSSNPVTITVTGDGTYTANFKKEFNISFQNAFAGVGNAGVMKVNGMEYTLPTSPFAVVQDHSISAEAVSGQIYNGIYYSFTQWEDGSTENPRTFTPTDHATYRAHYAGKPVAVTMKSLGGPVGEPVQIVWYNHVNPNVTQYEVWRKVKHNGVVGDPVLLATVNRPDSSYTDYDYLNTGSYTDDLLYYDARAYYSIEGSYADPHYTATFGEEALPKIVGGGAELFIPDVGEKPYSVSVSPNPFNSMAVIRFFLRERGHVVLSVMDILGREVIRLIDEEKESGEHAVFFDGSRFASGIYFYRLQAGSLSAVKKMVLVK